MQVVNQTDCQNEYDRLKQVVVTKPKYMQINEVINETQKHYLELNIDIDKAVTQHQNFTEVMQDHGVEVFEIEAKPDLNEQVFTRDIGFTIGDRVFVAQMATDLRKGETIHLREFLTDKNASHSEINVDSIEGGDVIIDGKTIWVGISDRTTNEAAQILREQLPDYEIETIHLAADILHLDCAFNLVGAKLGLVYPEGMDKADYQKLASRYELIEVDDEEQFTLGTNVLSIAKGKVISLPENKRTNEKLREAGLEVIEVPFNEIIKSGGSFRCCTMPILREK